MPSSRDLPDGLYRVEQRHDPEGKPLSPKFVPLKAFAWWPAFLRLDRDRCRMLNELERLDREAERR